MENRHLEREANKCVDAVQSVVNDLISEIENLESEKENLEKKLNDAEDEIAHLRAELNSPLLDESIRLNK